MVISSYHQICCPKGSIAPPKNLPLCEGEGIKKYLDYEYTKNYEALDALGCVAPKSKESVGSFTYNSETECFNYPGTKCKHGNQCGAKGNARI